jgi:hypothetical protein
MLRLRLDDANSFRAIRLEVGFLEFGMEPKASKLGDKYYDEAHMELDFSRPAVDFSQGSLSTESGCPRHVRFTPDRDRGVEMPVSAASCHKETKIEENPRL